MPLNPHDQQYAQILRTIMSEGDRVPNRTGIDTLSVLGMQNRYDLFKGFPCLTIKKVMWEKALAETLWFLSGDCERLQGLKQVNRAGSIVDATNIWEPWADKNGGLGPIYGAQWRNWRAQDDRYGDPVYIDQLGNAIERIKSHPDCRRIIVNAWNPGEIKDMALAPCHLMFQFSVRKSHLHLHMYQRSCDVPLGVPFNIFGYSAILAIVAKITNLKRGTFVHTMCDAHIYVNQIEGVEKILTNAEDDPRPMPELIIHGEQKTIDDFKLSDFEMVNYDPHPFVKIPVSV